VKFDMTNGLRPTFCRSVRSMELAGHARFDVVTALIGLLGCFAG